MEKREVGGKERDEGGGRRGIRDEGRRKRKERDEGRREKEMKVRMRATSAKLKCDRKKRRADVLAPES